MTSLAIVRRVRSGTIALGATMAIFSVAGLLVEIAWFYYPAVFAAALALRVEPQHWRRKAAAAAGAYTLACLLLTLLAAPVDTAGIAASWHGIPYPTARTGALCCLNFKVSDALGTARATLPNLPGYALALVLGALPLVLSLTRRPPARADATTWAAIAIGLACALAPITLTADWGRYIYLWCTTAFLMAWVLPRQAAPATAPSRAETASALLGMAALLLLYASTWQVLHYQFANQSALVPGVLFRALGSTGVLPLQN